MAYLQRQTAVSFREVTSANCFTDDVRVSSSLLVLLHKRPTWRIISQDLDMWLGPNHRLYKPWSERPFGRGPTTQPDPEKGLKLTMGQLTTYKHWDDPTSRYWLNITRYPPNSCGWFIGILIVAHYLTQPMDPEKKVLT